MDGLSDAARQVITDGCRETHGDERALQIALARVVREARAILEGWPQGAGLELHLVAQVKRPISTVEAPSVPPAE